MDGIGGGGIILLLVVVRGEFTHLPKLKLQIWRLVSQLKVLKLEEIVRLEEVNGGLN